MFVQEDSYWFVENDVVKAMCIECASKSPKSNLWFWEGSIRGYGDYDLNCSVCKDYTIYSRNKNDNIEEKKA